jgi:Xaa-Pro dipeptidase
MNEERLSDLLRRHEIHAVIAISPENIRYASGYGSFQGVWNRFPKALIHFADGSRQILVLPISEAGFVADAAADGDRDIILFGVSNLVLPEAGQALDALETRIRDWTVAAEPGLAGAVANACRTRLGRNARIAVDRTGAPELFDALKAAAADMHWIDRGEDLWRFARMVKSDDEIRCLAAASTLNEIAIAAMHEVVGIETDAGVAQVFRAAVASGGGNVQHFVGNAGRLAGAYRGAGEARAVAGERFRFDVGVELNGYCSDLGGTAQVGTAPSADEQRVYDALTAGIDRAVEFARPGVRTSDLYAKVIDAVRKAGLPDYRFSLVGHGIGVEPRDWPIVAPPMRMASPFLDSLFDPQLEVGMVINIECPLNCLADGAYQHEITLKITGDGAVPMSARRDYLIAGKTASVNSSKGRNL